MSFLSTLWSTTLSLFDHVYVFDEVRFKTLTPAQQLAELAPFGFALGASVGLLKWAYDLGKFSWAGAAWAPAREPRRFKKVGTVAGGARKKTKKTKGKKEKYMGVYMQAEEEAQQEAKRR